MTVASNPDRSCPVWSGCVSPFKSRRSGQGRHVAVLPFISRRFDSSHDRHVRSLPCPSRSVPSCVVLSGLVLVVSSLRVFSGPISSDLVRPVGSFRVHSYHILSRSSRQFMRRVGSVSEQPGYSERPLVKRLSPSLLSQPVSRVQALAHSQWSWTRRLRLCQARDQ